MKTLLGTSLILAFLVVALAATDLTGMWSLDLLPDFGGVDDHLGCSFLQEGERLIANCGGGPNIFGNVLGRKVTLLIKTGPKNEFTATFTGELDQRETTISGTWQLTDDTGRRDGKFTAKKIAGGK